MNKSDSIAKLSAALVKVQAELKPVFFDAENPFLHNQYATLGAVIEASVSVMSKYGLAITQLTTSGIGQIGVTTVLLHESGEYIETTVSLNLGDEKGKSLAQVAGSIITYLRRYSWAAILGLYAEEDTDGNGKGTKGVEEKKKEKVEQEDSVYPVEVIGDTIEIMGDAAPTNDEAVMVLDLAIIPTNATRKTYKSWLNHVKIGLDAGKSLFDAAEAANGAYKAATTKKK